MKSMMESFAVHAPCLRQHQNVVIVAHRLITISSLGCMLKKSLKNIGHIFRYTVDPQFAYTIFFYIKLCEMLINFLWTAYISGSFFY